MALIRRCGREPAAGPGGRGGGFPGLTRRPRRHGRAPPGAGPRPQLSEHRRHLSEFFGSAQYGVHPALTLDATLAGPQSQREGNPMFKRILPLATLGLSVLCGPAALAATAVQDNSSLEQPGFREHKTTYGVVYRLPQEVNAVLDGKINGALKSDLLKLGLKTEAETPNIPHVTVVHIHSADPTTPARMLVALPAARADSGHAQDFLSDRSRQGRRPSMVAGPGRGQERRRLRGTDALQHRGHGGAGAAARWPAAARHRSGVRQDGRRWPRSGPQRGRERRERRAGRPGSARAQPAHHAGLQHDSVRRAAAGRHEAGSRQVQRHPARRHPDHLQGCLHRRDRFRRQRAARDLPHQPGRRLGDRRGHRQAGRARA